MCRALGLTNPPVAVKFLDEEHRAKQCLATGPTNIGSEPGLYALLLKSRVPAAKPFRKWVTDTVLPAIRKDGSYVKDEEKVASGEMSVEEMTLRVIGALQAKVAALTEQARA